MAPPRAASGRRRGAGASPRPAARADRGARSSRWRPRSPGSGECSACSEARRRSGLVRARARDPPQALATRPRGDRGQPHQPRPVDARSRAASSNRAICSSRRSRSASAGSAPITSMSRRRSTTSASRSTACHSSAPRAPALARAVHIVETRPTVDSLLLASLVASYSSSLLHLGDPAPGRVRARHRVSTRAWD